MKLIIDLIFAVALLVYVLISHVLTLAAALAVMRGRGVPTLTSTPISEPEPQEEPPDLVHVMQPLRDWQPFMVHLAMRAQKDGEGLVMVKEGESVYVCSVGRN